MDLNPYRAGEADSPTGSRYTSIFQRLMAQSQDEDAPDRADGWMAELTLRPERLADVELAYTSRSGRRASDLGIIPVSLADYVALMEWTGKLLRSGQRTTIPGNLAELLDHIKVNPEAWLDTVGEYEQLFCHAVGPPGTLAEVAQRLEAHHLKGVLPPALSSRSELIAPRGKSTTRSGPRVRSPCAQLRRIWRANATCRRVFRSPNHRQGLFSERSRRLRNDLRTHHTAPMS